MQNFRSTFLMIGLVILLFIASFSPARSQDTLKVMYYNVLNFPGSTGERVIDFRTINQYIRPDIILICELNNEAGAISLLQDGLNVFGTTHYQRAVFTDGPDSDNMLFYNSDKVGLYSQDTIGTDLRVISEYVLYNKNSNLPLTTDTTFLYFYVTHLKASTGSANEQQRLTEVVALQQHIDNLPDAKNIFFGGDFNFYSSSDPAYNYLINSGVNSFIDPLPAGNWHDGSAFIKYHTQSTRTAQFGGGASGGMDDRFDFILFNSDVNDGTKNVTYVPGSCIALGNDSLHFNKSLIDLPVNTIVPDSVVQALYYMSDHLPVLCKIKIGAAPVNLNKHIDLNLFLEGPYNGTDMNADLNSVLPLNQPFNQPPWNYFGNESIPSVQNPDIVDWIKVEIRMTNGLAASATSDTKVWEKACILLKNGSIVDTDGQTLPTADFLPDENYYVVIRHLNHLDIMSSAPLNLNTDTIYYDFTSGSDRVYGGSAGCTSFNNGRAGMISGDAFSDGIIDQNDKNAWISSAGLEGYFQADFNMDGQINNPDKDDFFIKNIGKYSYVPQ